MQHDEESEESFSSVIQHPVWSKKELKRWRNMNEMYVDDIHIGFFYRPRMVLLLALTMIGLLWMALGDDPSDQSLPATQYSVAKGGAACVVVFLIFSSAALPNGPFVRPHPAVWRCVLGVSILYWLLLVFLLFQTRSSVRLAIVWLNGAEIDYMSPEDSPEYANDCSFTAANLWSRVDIFVIAHSLGWVAKALMLRSVWLCWLISIGWEVTEVLFSGVLPNFSECWWDQVLFDVLLCNALGIYIGNWLSKYLECREYRWESITDVPSLSGKVKRALLQFTPSEWTQVQWDPFSSGRRTACTIFVCFMVLLTDLSTFFLKHILMLPTKHRINVFRLVLWASFGMPALRQLYIYMTDSSVKRLGTQSWVACGVLTTELLICIKFGRGFFDSSQMCTVLLQWSCVTSVIVLVGMGFAELAKVSRWRAVILRKKSSIKTGSIPTPMPNGNSNNKKKQ